MVGYGYAGTPNTCSRMGGSLFPTPRAVGKYVVATYLKLTASGSVVLR